LGGALVSSFSLVGDVGGTHTRLAFFNGKECLDEKRYYNSKYSSLSEILTDFLSGSHPPSKACLGVAGPVLDGKCSITNLTWTLDSKTFSKEFNIPHFFLLNDLEAAAYGIALLPPHAFMVLNEGKEFQTGHKAVISAGTGLGEAAIFFSEERSFSLATEGGHSDFAPRYPEDLNFWLFLHQKYGHVSYERVLSGKGICDLYFFLSKEEIEDPREISERALNQKCPLSIRALNWFVSFYGSEAGNLALKYLSLGGVFIGGGIAPNIISFFQTDLFMKSFLDKGRFRSLLEKIPVKIILEERVVLLGAGIFSLSCGRNKF
jgi:glucokinase